MLLSHTVIVSYEENSKIQYVPIFETAFPVNLLLI